MKKFLNSAAGFLTLALALPVSARAAELKTIAWPDPVACRPCVLLQFGELHLSLPPELVGTIFVSNMSSSAVHLIPTGAPDGRTSALLISESSEKYVGKYAAIGLRPTLTAVQFFDQLGASAKPGTAVEKARVIEGIATAVRYTRSIKDGVTAYWIQDTPGRSQYVHFVIEGNDTIYSLVGNVTPELYHAVLSNLKVAAIP